MSQPVFTPEERALYRRWLAEVATADATLVDQLPSPKAEIAAAIVACHEAGEVDLGYALVTLTGLRSLGAGDQALKMLARLIWDVHSATTPERN